jgi:hypothetical protein
LALAIVALAPNLAYAVEPPTVTGLTPHEGGSAGGTKFIVAGTHFEGVTGVNFGLQALKIVTGTLTKGSCKFKVSTEIECDSPFHEAGTVAVTVVTPGGTSAETPADRFTTTPEAYRNEVATANLSHISVFDFGQVTMETPEVENTETHVKSREVELECVNLSVGSLTNEGTEPPRAFGQVLEWWAMGHTPTAEHTEVSPTCRFTFLGAPGGEAWVTAERPLRAVTQTAEVCINPAKELSECKKKVGEPGAEREFKSVLEQISRETLTTPWNMEAFINSEGKRRMRVGISSETGKSCAEEPAPPGCVRLTIVYPALNLFFPFEGSLEPTWVNGAGNGLSPSSLEFEGERSGTLRAAGGAARSTLSLVGSNKIIGTAGQELVSVK